MPERLEGRVVGVLIEVKPRIFIFISFSPSSDSKRKKGITPRKERRKKKERKKERKP